VPNGEKSRDGKPYLWFKYGEKSILSHRFVSAVTIGKWVPRECQIDHINHDPSDNRPTNLRITTPRDNAGNRRAALLPELVDIGNVQLRLKEATSTPEEVIVPNAKQLKEAPEVLGQSLDEEHSRRRERAGPPKYTGATKPGNFSGTYFGTTLDSWHWYPDGAAPDSSDYVPVP